MHQAASLAFWCVNRRHVFVILNIMNKIMLTGCPCSGKSTLANTLSLKLNVPVFHLDMIFHLEPGGIAKNSFYTQQKEYINSHDCWIIDGDFTRTESFELRVQHSDTIIIYELPKYLVYWRFIKRFFRDYGKSRPDMPDSRKETFRTAWVLFKLILGYTNEVAWKKIKIYGSHT